MTDKMMVLFRNHLKVTHNLQFYPYQLAVAERIFDALIQNLRLTANASEDDIRKLKLTELPIEFSRQSGKTTAIVHVIEFIMIFFTRSFGKPIATGIFAPQREQAKTDFDRLKSALRRSTELTVVNALADEIAREESNAKTIVLPNGSSCYIFPVTQTSRPESKTLDLIIFEESQDTLDSIIKEQVWPMGAATNAPRIYIGTAGTRLCYFRSLGQSPDALKLYFNDIVAQRRQLYEASHDVNHLIYEQTVKQEITKHGLDSDEIQRPYFGKWLIGTGQFSTQEDLDALISTRGVTYHEKTSDCYAGIDTAKHPDSTVVTVLRFNKDVGKKELLNWLELRGENYQDQFDIIVEFLHNYKIVAVAIDSTGQGDFMPDLFERNSEWVDERSGLYRVKFSAVSKDIMYKNLKVSIRELLTSLPNAATKNADKFRQQLLDLQQEYKGQLLSVHHPDSPNAHDDYPDSWALAEYAYAEHNKTHNADIQFITSKDEPAKAIYKETDAATGKERITDYWPGLD